MTNVLGADYLTRPRIDMPGPAPKPTALKLIQGNAGKRPLNKREPKFAGAPTCPSWLTKQAKAEWKRVVAELAALDMIRSVDSAALAAYCQSYARWRSAEEIVDAEGQTIQEPVTNNASDVVGYKVERHPATTIAKDALTQMLRAAALFGFDPSSRSHIHVPEAPKEDLFGAYMAELRSQNLSGLRSNVARRIC
jgi:P27 family predicted phage terminase small subunit